MKRNSSLWRPALTRGAGFLVGWVALMGGAPLDLVVGMLAAGGATAMSLRLLPPGRARWRWSQVAGLGGRFLWQSVVAGVDVAWRAFHPRLPLRAGWVAVPVHLPPGPARNAFLTLASLLPGTVPAGTNEAGLLLVHCLDTNQPVAEHLRAEERRLARALGAGECS